MKIQALQHRSCHRSAATFLAKALNSGRLRAIYFMTSFVRVPFDRMIPVMTRLEQMLISGEIDVVQFNVAWHDLLQATGWTDDDVAAEIDLRWFSSAHPEESYVC